jgi:large subunit ribosomal protein L11
MSKKAAQATTQVVKLFVDSGKATPGPPIGPALGSKGVKAIDFCKQFNEQSVKKYASGVQVRARVTIKPDRSFTMEIRPPSSTWLLKKAAGIEKGATRPGHEQVGEVSLKHIYEIAKIKKHDKQLETLELKSICHLVIATTKTMGIKVVP